MRITQLILATSLLTAACIADQSATEQDSDLADGTHGAAEPPMLGAHVIRGAQPGGSAGTSPDLIYHSGQLETSGTAVKAIYWGTKWSNASFVGDKQTGLASFYSGVGGSRYMGTNTEYTDTSGAHVSAAVSYGGYVVDTSAAPSHAPKTSAIQAEVCKMIANPVANGYYPVYVDTPRGHAGYCAWHSYGTCNGVPVQFGFFFNLDGDSGCDPQDTSGLHSQGLAALANVSGHELSEMVTDPRNGGYWDSSGSENADKCAWHFNKPSTFGGTSWKVQGNWSNAAYDGGQTGYYGGGCIDGN